MCGLSELRFMINGPLGQHRAMIEQRAELPDTQSVSRLVWCSEGFHKFTQPALPGAQMRYDAAASRRIRGAEAVDADRRLFAQYFVHQVLDTDITNLQRVWRKARRFFAHRGTR